MQLELWSAVRGHARGWSGKDLCKLALEGLELGLVGLAGGQGEGQIFCRDEGKGTHAHDRAVVEDTQVAPVGLESYTEMLTTVNTLLEYLLRQARKRVRSPSVVAGCLGRGYCRGLPMTGG